MVPPRSTRLYLTFLLSASCTLSVVCKQDETRIGRPLVPDARVIAAVEVLLHVTLLLRKHLLVFSRPHISS